MRSLDPCTSLLSPVLRTWNQVLISICLVHATSAAVADLEEDGEFVGRLVQTETCGGEAATLDEFRC